MLASPRISGQREHHGEIVATAVWPAIISAEDGAAIRALLANPERRTNKAARRYLLGGLLVCSHCGERLVARPRTGGQRRYACAKGAGLLRLRQDLHQRRRGRAVRDRGGPASARLGRAAAHARAATAQAPDAQRWLAGDRAGTGAAGRARRPPTATREISMDECAPPASRSSSASTDARKQLAKVSRTNVLDGYVGNGDRAARRVGLARPQPAARDRRRRRRLGRRRPRHGAATTASTSRA